MKNDVDNVILVCPCCASPVDAQAGPAIQELDCAACGQTWQMVIDAERVAEYALT
jgi:hypothetical protein